MGLSSGFGLPGNNTLFYRMKKEMQTKRSSIFRHETPEEAIFILEREDGFI